MGFYTDQVLPRVANLALGTREHAVVRARVASGLEGEVLEIGFGSGLNVPFYPRAVTRVQAVEPAAGGRALAPGGWRPARCRSSTPASTARRCPPHPAAWTAC